MDTAIERKAHVFRLPTYHLDRLKDIAAKDRRSLNNYVEGLLLDAVTRQAMEDSKAGRTEIM